MNVYLEKTLEDSLITKIHCWKGEESQGSFGSPAILLTMHKRVITSQICLSYAHARLQTKSIIASVHKWLSPIIPYCTRDIGMMEARLKRYLHGLYLMDLSTSFLCRKRFSICVNLWAVWIWTNTCTRYLCLSISPRDEIFMTKWLLPLKRRFIFAKEF